MVLRKKTKTLMCFSVLFCVLAMMVICTAASAEVRTETISQKFAILTSPERGASFSDHLFEVLSSEDGTLVMEVQDGERIRRQMEMPLEHGSTAIHWDGLGEHGEPLPSGEYGILFSMHAQDGKTYLQKCSIQMKQPVSTALFALPSSEVLTLSGDDDWFMETALSTQGKVYMTFSELADEGGKEGGKELFRLSRTLETGHLTGRIRLTERARKSLIAGKDYLCAVFSEKNPSLKRTCTIRVVESAGTALSVQPTGEILPRRGMSDSEVWEIMQKPSATVNIRNVAHLQVYEAPGNQGKKLGTLHGQSQALQVHAIEGESAYITAWNHESGEKITGYVPVSKLMVVTPSPTYGILVDKQDQTMTLYREGERVTTVRISTGLATSAKPIRETAAGAFLTDEHVEGFSDGGFRYEYPTRYDGGNLIHQVGWKKVAGRQDVSEQTAQLGQKASHACIRMPADGELTAYWFWTHIPYRTRVIVLDDDGEMEADWRGWGKAADEVTEDEDLPAFPSLQLLDGLTIEDAEDEIDLGAQADHIRLTFGGDVVLGTRESWMKREDALPRVLEENGFSWPFRELAEIFQADDLTQVNLECVLKSNKNGENTDKLYRFRGLPSYTAVLTGSYVEMVNLANNHFIDYGYEGRRDTKNALDAAGILHSGYGETKILEIGGHRIGFGGIRETTYRQDKSLMSREIREMREEGAEVIIYTCHWGEEYNEKHNDLQLEMAKAAADAGADLVIGGHPHVVQGIDKIDDTVVVWSLGNLMFGGTIDLQTFDGLLLGVDLEMVGKELSSMELHLMPVLTSNRAEEGINSYQPCLAEGEDKDRIMKKIQNDSGIHIHETMRFE